MTIASGTFEVKMTPQADEPIGRFLLDKQFHGDLEGSSKGQMLAFRSAVDGSAGYVAMERVSGSLGGRTGSFVLQHSGSMARGVQGLSIAVVADSGTDGLAGLAGTMSIEVAAGKHSYRFEYSIGR